MIHRDSFSSPHKPSISQPGTPAEPIMDSGEARLQGLEHSLYDLHARLMRTEESNTALSAKCQALNDSLVKCHQVSEPPLFSSRFLIIDSGILRCLILSSRWSRIQTMPYGRTVGSLLTPPSRLVLTRASPKHGKRYHTATRHGPQLRRPT